MAITEGREATPVVEGAMLERGVEGIDAVGRAGPNVLPTNGLRADAVVDDSGRTGLDIVEVFREWLRLMAPVLVL